ncbi:MAG: nuclease-related domain-containing protein [Chloroflexota bacterium]
MRVETNERLAHRNRQIAQYLFFATFGILILGLLVINQQAATISQDNVLLITILQTAILPVAFITTIVSVRMTNLWVRQPRPEVVIREGLKGISNKSVLYNYYHFPARHVLICPQGVFAIVTRFQDGRYTVNGDQWTTHKTAVQRLAGIFRFDGMGNPTADAQKAAASVQAKLHSIAPNVEVRPLIVFVDPKADVTINDPTVPVVYPVGKKPPTLKDILRDVGKDSRMSLTPEQIQAFEEATLPH